MAPGTETPLSAMKRKFGRNTIARSPVGLIAAEYQRMWVYDELREYMEGRTHGTETTPPLEQPPKQAPPLAVSGRVVVTRVFIQQSGETLSVQSPSPSLVAPPNPHRYGHPLRFVPNHRSGHARRNQPPRDSHGAYGYPHRR